MSFRIAFPCFFAGAWALLLAAGCASPRYQSVKRYEMGTAAPACLTTCTASDQSCKQDCQSKREACVKTLEPEAQTRYQAAIKRHEQALNAYRWELDRYRQELVLGYYGWSGWGYYTWFPPFPPPPPPAAPTLADETVRLERERCDQDCACQGGYDACYLGCGGHITHDMQCVAHCPPPHP